MGYKGSFKTHCKRGHLLSEENVNVTTRSGYVVRNCKECLKIRFSKYIENNREEDKIKHSEQHRQRTFKLSPQAYISKLKNQNDSCAICEKPFTDTPDVDHNHSCCSGKKSCGKCVRGLLCWGCNGALGQMNDSPELLRKAADYIEFWRNKNDSGGTAEVFGKAQTGC